MQQCNEIGNSLKTILSQLSEPEETDVQVVLPEPQKQEKNKHQLDVEQYSDGLKRECEFNMTAHTFFKFKHHNDKV